MSELSCSQSLTNFSVTHQPSSTYERKKYVDSQIAAKKSSSLKGWKIRGRGNVCRLFYRFENVPSDDTCCLNFVQSEIVSYPVWRWKNKKSGKRTRWWSHTLPKNWNLKKLEFVKGTKNEGGRRPIFTIKVYPFCIFSAVYNHSSHPHMVRGGGSGWVGGGSGWVGGGSGWVGGLARWWGVWLVGWGVWSGGGSGWVGGGRLHSKVWTDAHMSATGF